MLKNTKLPSILDLIKNLDKEQKYHIFHILKKELQDNHEIYIPTSIFNKNLSSLESISRYLTEHTKLTINQIAILTNRNTSTIRTTYNNAIKKYKHALDTTEEEYFIPLSTLKERKPVLKTISNYLKDNYNLKTSEIAKILNRDYKTIYSQFN